MFGRRAAWGACIAAIASLALSPLGVWAQARKASPLDSVVLIRTQNSLRSARGSGFVIGDGSWVVTAGHVVAVDLGKGRRAFEPTAVVHSGWTGKGYEAQVVGVDPETDLALLRLPVSGLPSLPLESLESPSADAALMALKDRPLKLCGFPLTFGANTVTGLARPEEADSRLEEIASREQLRLCVLKPCPNAQPGWSGGPILAQDRGTVVGVFHSLYHKPGATVGLPSGSLIGHLTPLLTRAGITNLPALTKPVEPALPAAPEAAERLAHTFRAISLAAAGDWKAAVTEQVALTAQMPGDAVALAELSRLHLLARSDEEALKRAQEAKSAAPGSVIAGLALARALHANYEPDRALALLRELQTSHPKELEPLLVAAQICTDNQKPDAALEVLQSAVRLSPENPVATFQLGQTIRRLKKRESGLRPEDGMKLLAKAAELSLADPLLFPVAIAYAKALEEESRLREAESVYRQILRVDSEHAWTLIHLGRLYVRMKRHDDAQVQVNTVVRLKSLPEELVDVVRDLQERINRKGVGQ